MANPHPNERALANLKPHPENLMRGSRTNKPMVLPQLVKVANRPLSDLMAALAIVDDPELMAVAHMKAAEALAVKLWWLALQPEGWRERELIINRLDGPLDKTGQIEVQDNRMLFVRQYVGIDPDQV